jgi:hypothetical protein
MFVGIVRTKILVRRIFLNEVRAFGGLLAQGDYDTFECFPVHQGIRFVDEDIHVSHCFGETIDGLVTALLVLHHLSL